MDQPGLMSNSAIERELTKRRAKLAQDLKYGTHPHNQQLHRNRIAALEAQQQFNSNYLAKAQQGRHAEPEPEPIRIVSAPPALAPQPAPKPDLATRPTINTNPADRSLIAELADLLTRHSSGAINNALWDLEKIAWSDWRKAQDRKRSAA
jgi:hypothetical protein